MDWLEMKHWHWAGKFHYLWLANAQFLWVPFTTLDVKLGNESTIFWMLGDLMWFLWYWNEIKFKSINWCTAGLSGESLEKRCSESIWISESTNPEVEWNTFMTPG